FASGKVRAPAHPSQGRTKPPDHPYATRPLQHALGLSPDQESMEAGLRPSAARCSRQAGPATPTSPACLRRRALEKVLEPEKKVGNAQRRRASAVGSHSQVPEVLCAAIAPL